MADDDACAECGAPLEPGAATCSACGVARAPPEDLFGQTQQRWGPTDPGVPPFGTDNRLGQVVAGKYRIVRRIGQGGMGSVYAAWQMGAEQPVALKFINPQLVKDPDAARRFTNEARSYARLQHPNAVTLHDVGQDESGAPFICMEMVQGTDLSTVLEHKGRLSLAESVEIALQVADVLGHAHGLGIIHRDLKPENILVRSSLRGLHAKVVDFGIARLLGDPTSFTGGQGPLIGTPGYMAPEQIQSLPVDGRADLYALGILLYYLVTGRHPFADVRGYTELLFAQVKSPLPPMEEANPDLLLPPALEQIIQRCTMKDPAERYPTMAELIDELTQLQRNLPAPSEGDERFAKTSLEGLPSTPLRPGRSWRWAFAVAGVSVLVLGVLAGVALSPSDDVDSPPLPAPPPSLPGTAGTIQPPVEPGEPGASAAAQEVQRVLSRQTALDVLVKASGELNLGNLEGARKLLDGSREVLDAASGDLRIQSQVRSLRAELSRVTDTLARAQSAARRGDCESAIKLYDELLRNHAGMRQARAAREECKQMLPPRYAE